MRYHKSIYQKEVEFGKVNVWDKYYLQPGKVSLEQALESNNYILADTSVEWFSYIRMRSPHKITTEYLRGKYNKYIRLQPDVIELCENTLHKIIPDHRSDTRLLAVILRGTDYLKYNHSVQPDPVVVTALAKQVFKKYKCDYYYICTEDATLYEALKKNLPADKVFTHNAGNVINSEGLVGEYLSKAMGEEKNAIDYIISLYILNKSCCLIGGLCGATIVSEYRRNPPYDYFNIFVYNKHY